MVVLIEAQDTHFAWLLTDTAELDGLRQPRGGIADGDVLALLRGIAADHRRRGLCGMWLIVDDHDVVGSCGYMREVASGVAEIGYGIASGYSNMGYATQAVAALVNAARASGLSVVIAGTAKDDVASQIVLRRNNFVQNGTRIDAEDGELIDWQLDLTATG